MQLTYRGCSYQLNAHRVEQAHSETLLNYRGVIYKLPQAVKPAHSPVTVLKYRGTTYATDGSSVTQNVDSPIFQPVI